MSRTDSIVSVCDWNRVYAAGRDRGRAVQGRDRAVQGRDRAETGEYRAETGQYRDRSRAQKKDNEVLYTERVTGHRNKT